MSKLITKKNDNAHPDHGKCVLHFACTCNKNLWQVRGREITCSRCERVWYAPTLDEGNEAILKEKKND